jgi:hypothetical protein
MPVTRLTETIETVAPGEYAVAVYSVLAAVGTLLVGHGVRESLRATGGGYYCCNHFFYQSVGVLTTSVGWAVLFVALYGVSQLRLWK